jgi:hypothetical protein
MSGDAFKRVTAGEPMEIPATAWNACLDAAEANRNGSNDRFGVLNNQFRNTGIVLAKNCSSVDFPRFGIAALRIGGYGRNTSALFTPADSLAQFQNKVALNFSAPIGPFDYGRFGICIDPIKAGKVGRVCVDGLCPVKVDVLDPHHLFCDVKNTTGASPLRGYTELRSTPQGTARIIYQETYGTGVMWCIVRLGDYGCQSILCKTSSRFPKNTKATLNVYGDYPHAGAIGGSAPGYEAYISGTSFRLPNVINYFADIEDNRWVAVSPFGNSLGDNTISDPMNRGDCLWYVVNAEAEDLSVVTDVTLSGGVLTVTRTTVQVYVKQ